MNLGQHLIVAPILIPLVVGALLLLLDERQRFAKAMIGLASTIALFAVALALFRFAGDIDGPETAREGVYLLGNWAAPFGIVLVVDRLSALMLVLAATLAIPALVYALARWHTAGTHFHSLYQFLLMGLNGAFLTGDLFNLFVFFEVMLAASYGLLLHGSGLLRVKAGLHYIAINLAAALLFLIGVSLIYGVTGTLNMADLAVRAATVGPEQRMLLEAGAGILGVAFLIKAGMWPLNFWLPPAYTAASAPVAGIFAILSKVGVYVVLRLSLLVFGEGSSPSAGFGLEVLLIGGVATMIFGAIGVLASQALGHLAGFSVLVSSGTLLTAIGMSGSGITTGALFYLVSSTLTISAFFMLIELVERGQDAGASVLAVTMEVYGDADADDEIEEGGDGVALPGTMAVLGTCFAACGILLAGLPPLSGFVAKFAILSAMLDPIGGDSPATVAPHIWFIIFIIIFSGLSALIAMTRSGIRTFWASMEGTEPRVLVIEVAPVLLLILATLFLTVQAGPVMRYMDATARALATPHQYIDAVLDARRAGPSGAEVPQ
ncbi:monovalent cation/H+ antiporter subunit D [Rhizobiaceae bacterium n13]|uniref:Monovalent cation/H+ antiporter subunit D n=1 Tax=Ferirhizobium litorale TaxID=2927786 RepID=A0AAE3QCH5_9HYPH|nr:monovalent cation/H+ antiporter subunit D [Fererhizobium litorale]MDI7862142.1 monovalent cation/H+ antiporter subunit D [Fererhizobium litorale]MDI7922585.1 monovalent cation/H+ antiporter subunit D [Fererhizobium litorale]